ncbi:17045_t:CDS:1, partial [Gigaspora margarita]
MVALEVDIDSSNLKVKCTFFLFEIKCATTMIIKAEEALPNLE